MPAEPNIRVAAVVHNEQHDVLLVRHAHRGKPFWTLPGGAPDGFESPDAAVVREVEEETGYRIAVDGIVAAGETILEARFFPISNLPPEFRPREAAALLANVPCVPYLDLTFERDA